MRGGRRTVVASALAAVAACGLGVAAPAGAAGTNHRTLVPIGSDYQTPTMEMFAETAAAHDTSGRVVLLVLPITYSRDATSSGNGERQQNLTLADTRRGMLEDACNAVRSPDQVCDVQLVPVLTRSDAFLASNLAYFTPDVDGMFSLGGDQGVAMGVVADTPLERAMADAYAAGAVFGGTSAGDAIQSRTMVNGFVGDFGPAESLRRGVVDIWSYDGLHDPTRGLVFGLPDVVMEQHVYEQGRYGRAVNDALTTGLPVLGMDAVTGGPVVDERHLTHVVGLTSGTFVDPVTYGASAHFGGPNATLSARGVVVHLMPPGGYALDLARRVPSLDGVDEPARPSAHPYPTVRTPSGSASLFLSGGLVDEDAADVLTSFVRASGGSAGRLVVIGAGYARDTDAQADTKQLAAALQGSVTPPVGRYVLNRRTDVPALLDAVGAATGVLLTAPDASTVMPALTQRVRVLTAVHDRWAFGAAALLADDAAAAAMGTVLVAAPPPGADLDTESSESFLVDALTTDDGLGWVGGLDVQPRLLPDRRWGHTFRLTWSDPAQLAAGIDVGTALKVRGGTARVVGGSAVVVLDGRAASFGTGSNGAMGALWVRLDTFVDGELLAS